MDEINNNDVQKSPSPAPSGTAGIVLGILSLLSFFGITTWVPFGGAVGLILAIIGCVSGNNCKKQGGTSAGLILSILGLVLNGIGFVACTLCVGGLGVAALSM